MLAICSMATAAENPPAPGFDLAGSDARAVAIADGVMEHMGGRAAWDAAGCISWTVHGRSHVWNKHTGDYRMEEDETVVVMNVNDRTGKAWRDGTKLSGSDADAALERAHAVWVNDSYWLIMPYKLKDTGVTLHYAGEATTEDGRAADVIEMTFRDVGYTPQNKYRVFVDRESGLVTQWAYYENAGDEEPRFVLPWTGWNWYGGIQLADNRGRTTLTGISVSDCADIGAFAAPPMKNE